MEAPRRPFASTIRLESEDEGKQISVAIKSDRWIRQQATEHGMISPFSEKQVREGVISYGLSSYGYDLRVSALGRASCRARV